jgi:micrococcal nuclease
VRLLRLGIVLALVCAPLAVGAGEGSFTLHGRVSYAVDGDTLQVALASGRRERVRLIGIDTPEVGECGYRAATLETRRLATGKQVVLRGDATQATRDRYGRLLAYVWLPGGRDLGYQVLRAGLARVYVYDRPFARLDAYRRAEREGRSRVPRCAAPVATSRCDPSYPGVCIPPPPPDLDCADVPYRAFAVTGADPHRFDGDGDGVGCED